MEMFTKDMRECVVYWYSIYYPLHFHVFVSLGRDSRTNMETSPEESKHPPSNETHRRTSLHSRNKPRRLPRPHTQARAIPSSGTGAPER